MYIYIDYILYILLLVLVLLLYIILLLLFYIFIFIMTIIIMFFIIIYIHIYVIKSDCLGLNPLICGILSRVQYPTNGWKEGGGWMDG